MPIKFFTNAAGYQKQEKALSRFEHRVCEYLYNEKIYLISIQEDQSNLTLWVKWQLSTNESHYQYTKELENIKLTINKSSNLPQWDEIATQGTKVQQKPIHFVSKQTNRKLEGMIVCISLLLLAYSARRFQSYTQEKPPKPRVNNR